MIIAEFTALVLCAAFAAGFLGSLTGLGGGVVVTPVLTLFLGVDLRYAIGATLIAVIATSSGAAAAYVRDGLSNIRIGMFLEIATTLGAVTGSYLGPRIPTRALSIVFGLVLLEAAWQSSREQAPSREVIRPDPLGDKLKLNGMYNTGSAVEAYTVHRVKTGFGLMLGAGMLSGLLGIGSGSLKVIAMDRAMQIPFKVSTATSNFMIGVTAAASASVYLSRGYVNPGIAMPVMLGVLGGSLFGARFLPHVPVVHLRRIFAVVVGLMALQMVVSGALGTL
jgi:hypothetical protein